MPTNIITSSVQNTIRFIKGKLDSQELAAFNDLLIISRIVPKLPEDTLLEML